MSQNNRKRNGCRMKQKCSCTGGSGVFLKANVWLYYNISYNCKSLFFPALINVSALCFKWQWHVSIYICPTQNMFQFQATCCWQQILDMRWADSTSTNWFSKIKSNQNINHNSKSNWILMLCRDLLEGLIFFFHLGLLFSTG